MLDLDPALLFTLLFFAAFVLEFLDITAGSGFGTLMAPLLLLFGVPFFEAVPTILLINAVVGAVAALTLREVGAAELLKVDNRRIFFLLAGTGVLGVVVAVLLSVRLPETFVKMYVAVLLLVLGAYLLHISVFGPIERMVKRVRRRFAHTAFWVKLTALGLLGGFNKAISAGGYGALLTGGQLVIGLAPKRAVSLTVLTESLLSFVAVVGYLVFQEQMRINVAFAIVMLLGTLTAVPVGAYTVKRIEGEWLSRVVASVALLLGVGLIIQAAF